MDNNKDEFPISRSTYGSLEECEREQARRDAAAIASQSQAAQPTIKTWVERLPEASLDIMRDVSEAKDAEIAELRAHIAGTSQASQLSGEQIEKAVNAGPDAVRALIESTVIARLSLATKDQAIDEKHLRKLVSAVSNSGYSCGKTDADDPTYDDKLGAAEKADKALISYVLAGTSQATKAQAEPAAWMRANTQEIVTAESKKKMEEAGYGSWAEVAAMYTIPLYAAPVAKEAEKGSAPMLASGLREIILSAKAARNWYIADLARNCLHELAALQVAPTTQQAAKAESEQAEGEQAHLMPPFAAPAGQHDAGWLGKISAGEYDRKTGTMYITVKLPKEGLPTELLTIGGAAVIAPASKPLTAGSAKGGNTNTNDSNSAAAPTTSTVSAPDEQSERFFMDHGVWHDRVTGQHMWTQDQYDEAVRDARMAGPMISTKASQSIISATWNDALKEAAEVARKCASGIGAEAAIRALRTTSTDQANADTGRAE